MNILERLLGAGESYGLERRSPATQANQPMTNTSSRAPMAQLKDIDDPSSPLYRQRHGGSVVTGLIDSVRSAVTLPRDWMEGRVDPNSDEAIRRSLDAVGTMNLGSFAAAPAGAVGSGAVRSQRLLDVADQYNRPQTGQSGLKTQYGATKHEMPFEDMTRRVIDDPNAPLAPWQEADLTKMVGGYGIPLVGDRTEAGKILTHINNQKLPWQVRLEGGYQYPQSAAAQGPDAAGWASHANPITTLSNRLQKAQKAVGDAPLYGIYSGMAEKSGDFSTMNADALLGMVHAGNGMDPAGMRGFDDMLRSRLAKDGMDPAVWSGLSNAERARELLLARTSGDLRKAFVETADTKTARDLGLPDVAAVRKATTAPHLQQWNGAGATGGSIVRFSPGGRPITEPAVPHGTYPHQYPGQYVGGLDVNLDRNELFPRSTAGQFAIPRSTGDPRTWANVDRAFMTNAGMLEKFDNEWLDTAMTALERRRANAR